MSKIVAAIGRKLLGLALIFNSVVSLTSAANILASFYINRLSWKPYSPYLIDGSLFWFVVLAAVLNIVPAKLVGKADIKRVVFHHYVYGFLSIFTSLILVALFAPAYIFILLVPSSGFQVSGFQNIATYAGLFFVYGGLTLVIDDIYDISLRPGRIFDRVRRRIKGLGRTLQAIHLGSSLISMYISMCAILWYLENKVWLKNWPLWDLANILFTANLLVTGIWGLKVAKEKLWFLKILAGLPKKGFYVHKVDIHN